MATFLRRLSWLIATAAGLGLSPFASGTVASFATAALWFALPPLSVGLQWAVGVMIALIGMAAAHATARDCHEEDPSKVVIDEVAGMWLALAGQPRTLAVIAVAFFAFRALDVLKPPPIRQLERLPGGIGIMADDVAAGLAAYAVTALFVRFLQ